MKPKVIHVVNLRSYGGIQKLVLELTSLQNNGTRIQNDLLATQKADLLSKKIPQNLNVIDVANANFFSKLKQIHAIFNSYDIIHFHGPFTFFQLIAIFSNNKIVYTEHGTLQKANIKNTLKHFIQKTCVGMFFLERYVDKVIFISKWIQKDLGLKNKNQTVIYNGLKYLTPSRLKNEAFTLTIAARLIPKKRVDMAIDVMHKLKDHPQIELQIIGDGPETHVLKAKAGDLLDKTVHFLGYRKDAYNIIASSDMYLMTTDMEPFGLVVLEAMMSETLVLALADSGGPTEILNENFPNLILNNVSEMADSVIYWKEHIDEKKNTESKLKKLYSDSYTMNTMASKYEDVYLQVLETQING